jgi:hypothetical protein
MDAAIITLAVALVFVLAASGIALRVRKLARKKHDRWMKVHAAKFDRCGEDMCWAIIGPFEAEHAKSMFFARHGALRMVETLREAVQA